MFFALLAFCESIIKCLIGRWNVCQNCHVDSSLQLWGKSSTEK